MVVVSNNSRGHRRNYVNRGNNDNKTTLARITLFLILFWPLGYILYQSSSSLRDSLSVSTRASTGGRVRKLGTGTPADTVYYAYVVYGRDERILQSVQSILDTEAMDLSHRSKESDMHTETLAILPVLDGVDDSVSSVLKQKLKHQLGPSSLPIHLLVYSQEEQVGVARSRLKAVEFIEMLASKSHISEDKIVLVLVRGDAVLKPKWMDPVLEALHLGGGGSAASASMPQYDRKDPLKLSNVISFSVDRSNAKKGLPSSDNLGSAVTFNYSLEPAWMETSNNNSRDSSISAGLGGAVSAMRLSTFQNFVVQDKMLYSPSSADMEIAFNAWMCGDGIDVLPDAKASLLPKDEDPLLEGLSDFETGRIIGTWMTEGPYSTIVVEARGGEKVSDAIEEVINDVKTRRLYHLSAARCRSFDWFIKEINTSWKNLVKEVSELKGGEDITNEGKTKSTPIKRYTDATDAEGKLGYIYDETWLRDSAPISQNMSCGNDVNYKMLTEKVQLAKPSSSAPTILCIVYTIEKYHYKISSIASTWGPQCDGLVVASDKTVTEPGLHTVNIIHEGPEEYKNMWQKVRSIWRYVYENYYDKYDYFHIGGDDLFLIIENLKYYLESDEIQSITDDIELFMGRRFARAGNKNRTYNSGGSGYTMNKRALKMLAKNLFERNDRICQPKARISSEDVAVANCFRVNNVHPYDTRDEHGSERYMHMTPKRHLKFREPKEPSKKNWYIEVMKPFNLKFGLDHFSKYSVAFHNVEPDEMKRYYSIVHDLCS